MTRALTAKEIRVGVAVGAPPIIHEEAGELRGLEIDMARELEKDLNLEITFVPMDFPRLIPALVAGEIDVIMSGMSETTERARTVSFTRPYLRVGQMALRRAADAGRPGAPGLAPSTRASVGFERGTTGEMYCRGRLLNARLHAYATAEDGIAALRAGEVDFFVHDAPTVWTAAADPAGGLAGMFEPLTEEVLAWAVRRWDEALRDRLDDALRRWEEDGRLRAMVERRVGAGAGAR